MRDEPRPGEGGENGGGDGGFDAHDPDPPEAYHQDANAAVRNELQKGERWLPWSRRREQPNPVVLVADRYLTGTLDLRAQQMPHLLRFENCRFATPPDLRQATLAGCEFDRCWLPGLNARNLHCENDLSVWNCIVDGSDLRVTDDELRSVDLTDAEIKGSLNLAGSTLVNRRGPALHANRLEITGAFYAAHIHADGEIRIPGTRVGGNVNLRGATLSSASGFALNGNGMQVSGNLLCDTEPQSKRPFSANGVLLMTSSRIASDLVLRGAELRQDHPQESLVPPEDPKFDYAATLVADRSHIEGNAYLDRKLHSKGTIRMVNAEIGGSLWLNSTRVDAYADGDHSFLRRALHLDGSRIGGDLEAADTTLTGQLRLADVEVRGTMLLDRSIVRCPGDDVVRARRLTVGGNLDYRDGTVDGSFLLQGAGIGANLDLRGTTMAAPASYKRDGSPKPSLDIRAVTIGRDLICAHSDSGRVFHAWGEIRMNRASVAREANFHRAVLGGEGTGTALNAFGASFQDLVVTFGTAPNGTLNMRHATCSSLTDGQEFWTARGGVATEDFRYDSLAAPVELRDGATVRRRLAWLRTSLRQVYRPGPYDQLAAVFRAAGNEEHASTVLIEKQWRRYQALGRGQRVLRPGVWLLSTTQWLMVGYGYQPTRALVWLLGLLAFGTLWFGIGVDGCVAAAQQLDLVVRGPRCTLSVDDTGAVWNPFLYTLDLLVPIVDFGNKNRWHMAGVDQWISALLVAMGWVLATTVAAGVTRALRRE